MCRQTLTPEWRANAVRFILPSVGRLQVPPLRHTQSSPIARQSAIVHCSRPLSDSAANSPSDCGTRPVKSSNRRPFVGRGDCCSSANRRPIERATNRDAVAQARTTEASGTASSVTLPPTTGARGNVDLRLHRQRPAGREVIFPARWTGVVGREEAGNAAAVVRLTQIGGAGDDVVGARRKDRPRDDNAGVSSPISPA